MSLLAGEGRIPGTMAKVGAIKEAPAPKDEQQLRSFLGLLNYYGKFLPNLSTKLAPLHSLLEKGKGWQWTKVHRNAFDSAKELLTSSKVLTLDSKKEVILACDASPYGVGAVLAISLQMAVNTLWLLCHERWPQRRRTILSWISIIFGVEKFHNILFGRQLTIFTDHKPLKHLFGEDKPIPPMASA